MCEQEQMAAFGIVQLERVGDVQQEFLRYVNIAPLFEPGVPGQSDAGERGHFLPPQARSTASFGGRQPDIRWRQLPSMVQEEVGKIFARTLEATVSHGCWS